MLSATNMSIAEIREELCSLENQWDSFRDGCEEGYAGSPGEWMVERMDELETELKRRKYK